MAYDLVLFFIMLCNKLLASAFDDRKVVSFRWTQLVTFTISLNDNGRACFESPGTLPAANQNQATLGIPEEVEADWCVQIVIMDDQEENKHFGENFSYMVTFFARQHAYYQVTEFI